MNDNQEEMESKVYRLLSLDTYEATDHELITAVICGYEILSYFESNHKDAVYRKIIENKLDAVNDELSQRNIYLKPIILTDERFLLIPCSSDEFDEDDCFIFWRYAYQLENAQLIEIIKFVQEENPEADEFLFKLQEILYSRN